MRATTLVLFLGLVAVCGGNAPNARGQQDFAVQQLNNPPRTAVSSRVKREMERLRERGVYGADLREMLARGSLERTAEGDLIRADRIKNPRERVAALERVLSEKIHPNNLLYAGNVAL